jgi:N-acyl homoserine lactone hydrolase
MKRFRCVVAATVAIGVAIGAGVLNAAQSTGNAGGKSGVDKMYVLDCGSGHAVDQSRWSMGTNVGVPIDISVSCFLIHHSTRWFLWDTGISDHVASLPNGWQAGDPKVGLLWTRKKTLISQLAELKVSPSDIIGIGISHTHPDHIGNTELFPNTPVYIQRAEFESYFKVNTLSAAGAAGEGAARPAGEAAAGPPPLGGAQGLPPGDPTPRFSKDHKVVLIDEDLDVFKDGSFQIFGTPGHTPGHESAMVHLPKTGYVILTGDAIHLRTNWDNRRIPQFVGKSQELRMQTQLSMQRLADLMSFYKAQLWILHDTAQTATLKHSPQYYD